MFIPFSYWGQEALDPTSIYPLDAFGDDADVAVSMRRLRSDYNGPVVRLRNAGGAGTPTDFGFAAGTDYLDTASVATHCAGAGGCLVDTWYDQSGGVAKDLAAGASAPNYSTTVVASNFKTVEFNAADQYFPVGSISATVDSTEYLVVDTTTTAMDFITLAKDSSTDNPRGLKATDTEISSTPSASSAVTFASALPDDTTVILGVQTNGTTTFANQNGVTGSAAYTGGTPSGGSNFINAYGREADPIDYTSGRHMEYIRWPKSNINLEAVVTKIDEYYNILPSGDADANAYIAEVIAQGGTLSAGDETAIQTFYTELKDEGLYSNLDVIYPFIGGTAASNAVEGKDPGGTYDLTFNGTWVHSVSGSSCTQTAGNNADTNFDPNIAGDVSNSFSFGVYTLGTPGGTGNGYHGLGNGTSNYVLLGTVDTRTSYQFYNASNNERVANGTGDWNGGVHFFQNRTSSTAVFGGYADSTTAGVATFGSTYTNTYTPGVFTLWFCSNNGNDIEIGGEMRFGWSGRSFTTAELQTLSDKINDLQTAFSRNVYT